MVKGKKFPYTKQGMAAAARAKKKQEGGRVTIQPVKPKKEMSKKK
jgi:hypothetical protein